MLRFIETVLLVKSSSSPYSVCRCAGFWEANLYTNLQNYFSLRFLFELRGLHFVMESLYAFLPFLYFE